MSNPFDNMVSQLASKPGAASASSTHFNPNPPGVIRAGSATHQLLGMFQASPDQWLSHAAIAWRTGIGQKALSWALIYLRSQKLIESTPDDGRNSRYLKYRFITGERSVQAQVSEAPQAGGVSVQGDAPPLPGAEVQGLPPIRRRWNRDLPTVAAQLAAVHRGRGAGAELDPLAGAPGCNPGLHTGKRDLDNSRRTDAAPKVVPQGDVGRPGHDIRGGYTPAGHADLGNGEAAHRERIQSSNAEAGQAVPQVEVGDMARGNPPAARVGRKARPAPFPSMAAHEKRDATVDGDAAGAPASLFEEAPKFDQQPVTV